jgi:hypothetical protein
MIQKQSQKTRRLALFSENERDYLNGKYNKSSVRRSQFYHDLEIRFDELLKDLELIRNSEKLKTWKFLRRRKYHNYFLTSHYFVNIFSDWKIAYPDQLHKIKKKKKILYWLKRVSYDGRIDDRLLNSDYLFRRIRTEISENDKKSLLQAYEKQNVLPLSKEDAVTLEEIKKRLNGESKIKTNITVIENAKENTFKDIRNQKIYKIVTMHEKRSLKSLNKKLALYDSHVTRYFVDPYYHAESVK